MPWPAPPPVKEKPPHPARHFFAAKPKNTFVAALIVLVPGILGALLGAGIAALAQFASFYAAGWTADALRHPLLFIALILVNGALGALLGLRSLARIMHYVALDARGLVKEEDEPRTPPAV